MKPGRHRFGSMARDKSRKLTMLLLFTAFVASTVCPAAEPNRTMRPHLFLAAEMVPGLRSVAD